eukprot:GHVU01019177.1.p1 GENE.GHVU01019177.1~~GHVU01019177.1.p1  ORF type:complete len:517 (+),score=74.41 GHVU01019177.1:206-1552(+)
MAAVGMQRFASRVGNDPVVDYVTGDDFSVVIPVRNEDDFIHTTIKYVMDNTTPSLLKEIIVVDDNSDIPVSKHLEQHLPKPFHSKLRIIRFNSYEGLIRCRIAGADSATASNVMFLDGHVKPKHGWLEPLLAHLKMNYRRLACPVIQDIHPQTWEDSGTQGTKMMFDWTFEFGWYEDLTQEVPLSSGGIIAITKRWWEESGKYDPGMLEWGGENIEQSLRVWMCGGEIYIVPQSYVGHIFNRPPKPNPENKLVAQVQANQKRAALVWLDDYYKFIEQFHPEAHGRNEGDISERVALRNKMKCQSFQWYVDRFRNSFERKGMLMDEFHHLRHEASRLCLTTKAPKGKAEVRSPLFLSKCTIGDRLQQWQTVGDTIARRGGVRPVRSRAHTREDAPAWMQELAPGLTMQSDGANQPTTGTTPTTTTISSFVNSFVNRLIHLFINIFNNKL